MSGHGRQPVAIRVTRPYDDEADFLRQEFETITRTSVILIGAQPRPQGVVLRFEITLRSGIPMFFGEGRVVGYTEQAFAGEPGLTLRFTRLDARSKTILDRAVAIREGRTTFTEDVAHSRDLPPSEEEAEDEASIPSDARLVPSPPTVRGLQVPDGDETQEAQSPVDKSKIAVSVDDAAPPLDVNGEAAESGRGALSRVQPPRSAPSPSREAILQRLRSRAEGMTDEQITTVISLASDCPPGNAIR